MLHYIDMALKDPDGVAASRFYLSEANDFLTEFQKSNEDAKEMLKGELEEIKEERRDAYCRPLSPDDQY